jgi:hypothetical protein
VSDDNLPIEGTLAHPFRFDPRQRIIAVQWSGGIGVLQVDKPTGIQTEFDTSSGRHIGPFPADHLVERADFLEIINRLVFSPKDPPVLRNLYGGSTDIIWVIEEFKAAPGPRIGSLLRSPPDAEWDRYVNLPEVPPGSPIGYAAENPAGYLAHQARYSGEGYRWIEVSDLKLLSEEDTAHPAFFPYLYGDTWADHVYGARTGLGHLVGTADSHSFVGGDPDIPLNFGSQQFDDFAPAYKVAWGLGERATSNDYTRDLIRELYFIDFKRMRDAKVDTLKVSNPVLFPIFDDKLPPDMPIIYTLRIFSASTKFKLTASTVMPDPPELLPRYTATKSISYRTTGPLFAINQGGFVV